MTPAIIDGDLRRIWGYMMTVGKITGSDAAALLEDLRTGLNADGYDLQVARTDEKLQLRIVAREGACEDCLVPKEIMSQFIVAALQDRGVVADDIVLTYPAEH